MSNWHPPLLGWEDEEYICLGPAIAWRDRTVIGGVLGDPSQWAQQKAECEACAREIEYKRDLRNRGVIILSDYQKDTFYEEEIW
jgi:hypothetical protein